MEIDQALTAINYPSVAGEDEILPEKLKQGPRTKWRTFNYLISAY